MCLTSWTANLSHELVAVVGIDAAAGHCMCRRPHDGSGGLTCLRCCRALGPGPGAHEPYCGCMGAAGRALAWGAAWCARVRLGVGRGQAVSAWPAWPPAAQAARVCWWQQHHGRAPWVQGGSRAQQPRCRRRAAEGSGITGAAPHLRPGSTCGRPAAACRRAGVDAASCNSDLCSRDAASLVAGAVSLQAAAAFATSAAAD